jgi:hypothetical protein
MSYSILRDGGPSSAAFVEVHATTVNNKPMLTSYSITDLPSGILGKSVKFKVKVTNIGGYFSETCEALSVVIANVPTTPAAGPVSDLTITTISLIRVTYAEPANGGSLLTNYEVQMDDGIGGGFISVAGGSLNSHQVKHAIVKSSSHTGTIV